jgi:phage-related protein
MKSVLWLSDSRKRVQEFPSAIRQLAGYELMRVQRGHEPTDWKPMMSIGAGVNEIRVRDDTGAYRVVYVAKLEEAIYVLHAFQKKTPRTAKRDIDLAADRYRAVLRQRKEK